MIKKSDKNQSCASNRFYRSWKPQQRFFSFFFFYFKAWSTVTLLYYVRYYCQGTPPWPTFLPSSGFADRVINPIYRSCQSVRLILKNSGNEFKRGKIRQFFFDFLILLWKKKRGERERNNNRTRFRLTWKSGGRVWLWLGSNKSKLVSRSRDFRPRLAANWSPTGAWMRIPHGQIARCDARLTKAAFISFNRLYL